MIRRTTEAGQAPSDDNQGEDRPMNAVPSDEALVILLHGVGATART